MDHSREGAVLEIMKGHLNSLYRIIRYGLNSNSYKFAFWRTLVGCASDPNRSSLTIPIKDLAPSFLEQYWPLEVQYHIRQSTDPDKDPVIMMAIRKLMQTGIIPHGLPLEKFKRQDPERYQALLTLTEKKAFNHVIWCFQDVRGADVSPSFFTHTAGDGKSGKEITLLPEAVDFLVTHAELIEYMAVSGWVAFTEKISSAPRLFTKLAGKKVTRKSLSAWREILVWLQQGRCFYCGSPEIENAHIDHFLPWSYVLEDRTWNLVLACPSCNGAKSDRLPQPQSIEALITRNLKLLDGTISVANSKFIRHFDEWRSRDLAAHIRSLHDQALSEQFPIWAGPVQQTSGQVGA
jgi:hypothetical protein